jgi:shikimate kinase
MAFDVSKSHAPQVVRVACAASLAVMSPTPSIETKRPRAAHENIFLLGPGGVGKATLGAELARQSGWPLIDLDLEFGNRIAVIGPFIASHGYEAYRLENLRLATRLVAALTQPTLFVTSSGFLAAPPSTDDHRGALALVRSGYGITVLPSLDLDEATEVVVTRQATRGFGFDRDEQAQKFRQRFDIYRDKGDMLVVSMTPASETAGAVITALGGLSQPLTAQIPTARSGLPTQR